MKQFEATLRHQMVPLALTFLSIKKVLVTLETEVRNTVGASVAVQYTGSGKQQEENRNLCNLSHFFFQLCSFEMS